MKKTLIQSHYEAFKVSKVKSPKHINLSKDTGVTSTARPQQDVRLWVTKELQKFREEMYRELGKLRAELAQRSDADSVGEERENGLDRSINQVCQTLATNLKATSCPDADFKDTIQSDDCDERRTYTPQPRQLKMITKLPPTQLTQAPNKSLIPTRSISQLSNIASDHSMLQLDLTKQVSMTMDQRHSQFQLLMDRKGTRCTCEPNAAKHCSAYCRRLSALDQRRIVSELLKSEQQRQTNLHEWEPKRYLIEQKWWSKWCDYVNFDPQMALDNSFDVNLLPKPPRRPEEPYEEPCHFYERPCKVINAGLFDSAHRQRLRANLIEHFDYEALHPIVWKHIYSWYGADIQIVRSLKKDVLNRHVMLLDLYPEQSRFEKSSSYQEDKDAYSSIQRQRNRAITPHY